MEMQELIENNYKRFFNEELNENETKKEKGLKTGKGKLEKWWFSANTREVAERLKNYSDEQIKSLLKGDWSKSEGLQKRQRELLYKEAKRRGIDVTNKQVNESKEIMGEECDSFLKKTKTFFKSFAENEGYNSVDEFLKNVDKKRLKDIIDMNGIFTDELEPGTTPGIMADLIKKKYKK